MVVAALTGNTDVNVDTAISKLENLKWLGVKGPMAVNPSNHSLTQDMFLVGLNKSGAHYAPSLLKTVHSVQG
jgi:hypothetical protein